jgi:hypothetical protein
VQGSGWNSAVRGIVSYACISSPVGEVPWESVRYHISDSMRGYRRDCMRDMFYDFSPLGFVYPWCQGPYRSWVVA